MAKLYAVGPVKHDGKRYKHGQEIDVEDAAKAKTMSTSGAWSKNKPDDADPDDADDEQAASDRGAMRTAVAVPGIGGPAGEQVGGGETRPSARPPTPEDPALPAAKTADAKPAAKTAR